MTIKQLSTIIAAVLLTAITAAGQAVFDDWSGVMEMLLARHGWPAERIAPTATAIIAC